MAELFKDNYNLELVTQFAKELKSEYKKFNKNKFIDSVINDEWEKRELKDRMRHISNCINDSLDMPYLDQLEILNKIYNRFTMWGSIVFPDFVEVYGLDYFEESVDALELYTKRSSSEFAVRPFILKYEDKMMKRMLKWSKDKNHHVRRLASEGCRPRLPWAMALPPFKKDPSLIIPILENLKNDESEYVRKSVANNLNDISKDNPNLVISIIKSWKDNNKNTDWICKHAARTLLKKGNEEVLEVFGVSNKVDVSVKHLKIEKEKIKIGEFNNFSFLLKSNENKQTKIRLEYKVYYVKANGKTSPKIFKISEVDIPAKSDKFVKRKQDFRELTTRKHYPGLHKISIVVNGKELADASFTLI